MKIAERPPDPFQSVAARIARTRDRRHAPSDADLATVRRPCCVVQKLEVTSAASDGSLKSLQHWDRSKRTGML
jgi:hypothetical protein